MLITGVLNVIWGIVEPILNRMPSVQINYEGIASTTVFQYIRAGLYFFPMQTVLKIGTIVLALWVFRIIIAFLKALWDALPIV